jgi:predicted nucleic acid-binding protein
MIARFFLDTNILVYANDRSAPRKMKVARGLVAQAFTSRRGCLSTQVLQEFFWAGTRELGLPADNARAQVLRLLDLDLVLVDRDVLIGAMDLVLVHKLSFWDALIVKSASTAGCRTLFTGDLQHGQLIDGIRIHDPFVERPT